MALDVPAVLARLSADPVLRAIRAGCGEGGPLYLVGGYLRDRLLRRPHRERDIDLAAPGRVRELAESVAQHLGGSVVPLDQRTVRVITFIEGASWQIDLSSLKGPSIEADLFARDFTIDALGLPLEISNLKFQISNLVDPVGGLRDLEEGVVRMTHPQVFEEDPLRLLRAFRLAAGLGFSIEEKTNLAISERAHLLSKVAGERIKAELFKLLGSPRSTPYVKLLDEAGLLRQLIPGFETGEQAPHLEALRFLEGLVERLPTFFPRHAPWLLERWQEEIEAHVERLGLVKLIALYRHREPEALSGLFARLRLGRRVKGLAARIADFQNPKSQIQDPNKVGPKALYRFFRECEEVIPELILSALADLWAQAEGREAFLCSKAFFEGMLDDVERFRKVQATPLLKGDDLIQALKLQPGPFLGFVLEKVKEAQFTGELGSKEEALVFVRDNLERWRGASR